MIGAGIVWAIMASSMVVYWYFLWRTAQRWNMLLRRAGKTPDDDVLRNVSKLVGFIVSDQHSAFNDAKLSQLVRGARISFGIAVVGVVLWATTVAVVR